MHRDTLTQIAQAPWTLYLGAKRQTQIAQIPQRAIEKSKERNCQIRHTLRSSICEI